MSEIYSYTVPHSGVNTTYYFEDTDLRNRISDAEAYVGYTDSDIAGLEVDYENNTFTRLAGAVGKSGGSDFNVFPTYAGMRRCILADDGTVVAYYGDSGYIEDGSVGQVMVEIPKFYYKVVPMKLQKQTKEDSSDTNRMGYYILKARYYISATPKTGFKIHPLFVDKSSGNIRNYAYISAYGAVIYDVSASEYLLNNEDTISCTATTGDKMSSINGTWSRSYTYYDRTEEQNVTITVSAGAKPATNGISGNRLTRHNFTTLAHNRGSGWEQETIEMISAIQLLFSVEYGSLNSQQSLGDGVTDILNAALDGSSFMGSTASLGNTSGNATSTIDSKGNARTGDETVSCSYRGIEDLWGNIYKFVEGINIWGDGTMGGGAPYICTDDSFTEDRHNQNYECAGFTISSTLISGYIQYFGYGSEKYDWLFIPSKIDIWATSSLPVGDNLYPPTNLNGHKVMMLGGSKTNDSGAGLFCCSMLSDNSDYEYSEGARLCYLPTA